MRFSVQKGGRVLAALMVASMLLWSLSLVLAGQANATTGYETTGDGHDGGDKDYQGAYHDDDGGQCPAGDKGKTGGSKDDCDHEDDDGGQCPAGHDGKTGGKDDCDEEDNECEDVAHVQGGSHGHDDDDDDKCTTTTSTTSTTTSTTTSSTTTTSTTTTTIAGVASPILVVTGAESQCVADVPYLSYALTFEGGLSARITFVNPDGPDVVHENMPMSGRVLWPGANDNPKDWPGWIQVDGAWVPSDDGYLWARGTITVIFEVNPTVTATVTYQGPGAICADPDRVLGVVITPPPPPPTDEVEGVEQLPFTGIDSGGLIMVALAILSLGTLLVVTSKEDEPESS